MLQQDTATAVEPAPQATTASKPLPPSKAARAPLAVVYEPVGVFVKLDGKGVFLSNKIIGAPANTTLWIAEPPIGSNPGTMIKLGTVKQGGLVEFDSASATVTPGNMVFTIKRGSKP